MFTRRRRRAFGVKIIVIDERHAIEEPWISRLNRQTLKAMAAWGRQRMGESLKGLALAGLLGTSAFAQTLPSADLAYIGSVELRPERSEMSAGWTIQVLDPSLEQIEFALAASFGTASISGRDVADFQSWLETDQDDSLRIYQIVLVPAGAEGRPRQVKFAYGGPFRTLSLNALDADHVELTGDSRWFPVAPSFDHRLSAQVGLRTSSEWTLIGSGESERFGSGYRLRQERPNFDIVLSILSQPEVFESNGYTVYDARSEPGTNWTLLKEALSGCRAFLTDLAGAAGPLPDASILLTNRSEGAYSRGTLLSLMDIENETDESLYKLVCHELTHHWSAASPGGPDDWINEGVAEYVALMAVRDHFGEDVFADYLDDYAQSLEEDALLPIWTQDAAGRTPSIISYRAAPLALAELEQQMGRMPFLAFLRSILTDRIGTTPVLLDRLKDMAGPEVRETFETRLTQ